MSTPSAPLFERPVRIRFAHCDPAGIVFFPQYLTLTNALVEDWFNEALGVNYAAMIGTRRIGLPIVKLECEFVRPSRMGESISMRLSLDAVGRRSIRLGIDGHRDDVPCFRSKQVLVTTSLDAGTSIDIPDDIRAALARAASPSLTCEDRSS